MAHTLPKTCLPSGSTQSIGALDRLADRAKVGITGSVQHPSPIDAALDGLVVVTRVAANEPDWVPRHGLILSAAAVAVAEDYFRTLLTELASVCPLTEERVQSFETKIEYVRAGSVTEALRGAIDSASLSSATALREWTKKIAGFNIAASSSLGTYVDEFERACHIRHCAVHAGGYVSSRNSRALRMPTGSWISFSRPDPIYEIVAVLTATVRSYNQSVFEFVLSSWINQRILTGSWNKDRRRFTALWSLFASASDTESAVIARDDSFAKDAREAYLPVQRSLRSRNASAS